MEKHELDKKFEDLYKKYYQEIYSYIFFSTQNRHDAEDIVQSTFLKAYLNFEKFKGENYRPWFYAIAKNLIIDRSRYKKPEYNDYLVDLQKDPSINVETRAEVQFIFTELNKLPLSQRDSIYLRYLNDLDYKDIANIIGKSEGHVRKLVSNGLKNIRSENIVKNRSILLPFLFPTSQSELASLFAALPNTNKNLLFFLKMLPIGIIYVFTIGIAGTFAFNSLMLNSDQSDVPIKVPKPPFVDNKTEEMKKLYAERKVLYERLKWSENCEDSYDAYYNPNENPGIIMPKSYTFDNGDNLYLVPCENGSFATATSIVLEKTDGQIINFRFKRYKDGKVDYPMTKSGKVNETLSTQIKMGDFDESSKTILVLGDESRCPSHKHYKLLDDEFVLYWQYHSRLCDGSSGDGAITDGNVVEYHKKL